MKIYIKLAFKYLRKQKTRTFSMILGVALAVMLVFGFDVITESSNKKQLDIINQMYGSYDGIYSNLAKEETAKIENDKYVKKSGSVASLGKIVSDNGTQMTLSSSDKDYIEMLGFNLKRGRLPNSDGEIVLESKALERMNLDEVLNQNIKLKVKKEYKDEFGINQIFIETKNFTLVGVTDKLDYHYTNEWYEFNGFTYFKESETEIIPKNLINYESIVKLKSRGNTYKKLMDLANKYSVDPQNITQNEILIMAKSEYISSNKNNIKIPIIATSIILVYNMFNMSLVDMIRQIGLLRAVGVSKRKVRIILLVQSIFILFVGTVLGLILGVVYSYFGMKLFGNNVIDIDIKISNKDLYISTKNIIKAIEVGAISVAISTIVPIWLSGRVTPIEAFNKTDKTSLFGKSKSISKMIRKLFGVTGEMAYSNTLRNKFRAIVSVIAIGMSGSLYVQHISVYNNMDFLDSITMAYSNMMGSSIRLHSDWQSDRNFIGYTEENLQKISEIEGVTNIRTKIELLGFLKTKVTELDKDFIQANLESKDTNTIESKMWISGYNNKSLTKLDDYIEVGQIIQEQTEEYPSAVICNYYDNKKYHKAMKIMQNLKIGDILTIKVPQIDGDKIVYKDQKVKVGALLKPSWLFKGDSASWNTIEVIVPDKYLVDMSNKNTYNEIFLETDKEKDSKIYSELKDIFKGTSFAEIYSLSEGKKLDLERPMKRKREYLITISLILAIAVINIYGTIKTSLAIRTNEFSVLKAIGMTTKQLKSMIIKETIIYGLLSSIVAGTIGTYGYYKFVSRSTNQLKEVFNIQPIAFKIPFIEIAQFTVVTMIICIFVAYLSKREIDKLSIVEGLKVIK